MRPAVEAAIALARLGLDADSPEPPPRGLVPLLRFSRLPDRALAAARKVLDDDERFRRRVRAATSEALVGRASWIFLDRPEGWEDELDGLAAVAVGAAEAAEETKAEATLRRRIAVLESNLDQEAEELARVRTELAEAKEQLAGERRARRLVESEAGRLRQGTVDLTGEVDDLRRRQSLLQEALDQIDHQPSQPVLPEALDEPSPPTPLVDRAELSAAIATGVEAARELSEVLAEAERLLAPAPPQSAPVAEVRPPAPGTMEAGTERRRPTALPPGTFDDSNEAAGHLVRAAGIRVLVDGYNVTKSARPEWALPEQRRWLADAAVELAARTGARVELVFDGADDRASAPAELGRRQGVQVRFTAEGVEADDVLLALVDELPVSVPVVVASDDRRVRDGARHRGANVMSAAQFLMVSRLRTGGSSAS